jgi:hypothetical protein
VSPKAKSQVAREHLNRALSAMAINDQTAAVTWLFAALEMAIVAIAEIHGIKIRRQHRKKAAAAAQLHRSGVLRRDFSQLLDLLNQARQAVVYEGENLNSGAGRSRTSLPMSTPPLKWRNTKRRDDGSQ